MLTIRNLLKKKSNNYTHLEKFFKKITGQDLLSKNNFKFTDFKKGISIVISSFNSNNCLKITIDSIIENVKNIPKKLIDLVIIDDGSEKSVHQIIKNQSRYIDLTLIRQYQNQGTGISIKNGVKLAKHENILFIDSDIILSNNTIVNYLTIHNVLYDKVLLTSFQETVSKNDERIDRFQAIGLQDINFQEKDFRNYLKIKTEWDPPNEEIGKEYRLLQETNYFKNFGYGKKIGLWTLPMMSVGLCMSTSRKAFLSIGGSTELLKGWGWNDTCVAAKLLAYGQYLVPCINSAVIHIEHPVRLGNKEIRRQHFLYNQKVYEQMISQPLRMHKFNKYISY